MSSAAIKSAPPEDRGELNCPPIFASAAATIAYLEARVATLEAELEQRSETLETIERLLCKRDQVIVARLCAGLPPVPPHAFEPQWWEETIHLAPAEVEATLEDLWLSIHPAPAPTRRAPQA